MECLHDWSGHLVPQECCSFDVKSAQSSAVSAGWLYVNDLKVQHGSPEAFDVLEVHFAEVSEVMLANKMAACLAHGCNVQLTILGDEVCVLPMCCTESAQKQTEMLRCTPSRPCLGCW